MRFSKTIVFGCGGTGSHLIPNLARFRWSRDMDDQLVLIDGDKIEKKNLARQAFGRVDADSMCSKAMVMADEAYIATGADHNPDAKAPNQNHPVRVVDWYLYGKEELYELLLSWKERGSKPDEVVAIFVCVDNNKSRKIVYDAVLDVNVPTVVIDCGNDLHTGSVNLWIHNPEEKFPFGCPLDKWESIREPKDRAPGESCTEAAEATPQLITANMMAAVLALHTYMKIAAIGTDEVMGPLQEEIRFDLSQGQARNVGLEV